MIHVLGTKSNQENIFTITICKIVITYSKNYNYFKMLDVSLEPSSSDAKF